MFEAFMKKGFKDLPAEDQQWARLLDVRFGSHSSELEKAARADNVRRVGYVLENFAHEINILDMASKRAAIEGAVEAGANNALKLLLTTPPVHFGSLGGNDANFLREMLHKAADPDIWDTLSASNAARWPADIARWQMNPRFLTPEQVAEIAVRDGNAHGIAHCLDNADGAPDPEKVFRAAVRAAGEKEVPAATLAQVLSHQARFASGQAALNEALVAVAGAGALDKVLLLLPPSGGADVDYDDCRALAAAVMGDHAHVRDVLIEKLVEKDVDLRARPLGVPDLLAAKLAELYDDARNRKNGTPAPKTDYFCITLPLAGNGALKLVFNPETDKVSVVRKGPAQADVLSESSLSALPNADAVLKAGAELARVVAASGLLTLPKAP